MSQVLKPWILIQNFEEQNVLVYLNILDEISLSFSPDTPIVVQIDSYGGRVEGMTLIYEYLKSLPNPIVTYTTSKAMSAGAILLSTAGSPGLRIASPNSVMMIHEVQFYPPSGDLAEIYKEFKFTEKENDRWNSIMAKSMKLKNGNQYAKLIRDNSGRVNMTAVEAKKLNLIDDICYIRMEPFSAWNLVKVPIK